MYANQALSHVETEKKKVRGEFVKMSKNMNGDM